MKANNISIPSQRYQDIFPRHDSHIKKAKSPWNKGMFFVYKFELIFTLFSYTFPAPVNILHTNALTQKEHFMATVSKQKQK